MKINKKTLPWIPLYYADILASVDGLSNEEAFAFLRLVFHFWQHGPIVNNKIVLDRIARMDSDLIVGMFFSTDAEGRLFPPDFADLKAQAIEIGKKNAERTAKATAAAKRLRNGSVTDILSVTETDTEGDGEGESEVDSNSNSARLGSVTEKFIQRFGDGSPLNGRESPRVASTPQTSVTDTSRVFNLSNGEKARISEETISTWKAQYPRANVEAVVRTWSNTSKRDPFNSAEEVREVIAARLEKAAAA